MSDWLIYGANGYTGTLIAKEAVSRGMRPVLAGRSRAVAEMATRLGLPHRIFGLDDAAAVREGLAGMTAVLHCAGPFAHTYRAVADACLAGHVHYLDVTGKLGCSRGWRRSTRRPGRRTSCCCRGLGSTWSRRTAWRPT